MLPRNRWFVAAALVYALAGGLLGLFWLAFPGALSPFALRAHAHLMLVGFVGMMIFGVGYHLLPRLAGHPLHRPVLARAHWGLANAGELLRLRDPNGDVVSRFPALATPAAGTSVARRTPDAPDTDASAFGAHASPGASPGRPNALDGD